MSIPFVNSKKHTHPLWFSIPDSGPTIYRWKTNRPFPVRRIFHLIKQLEYGVSSHRFSYPHPPISFEMNPGYAMDKKYPFQRETGHWNGLSLLSNRERDFVNLASWFFIEKSADQLSGRK